MTTRINGEPIYRAYKAGDPHEQNRYSVPQQPIATVAEIKIDHYVRQLASLQVTGGLIINKRSQRFYGSWVPLEQHRERGYTQIDKEANTEPALIARLYRARNRMMNDVANGGGTFGSSRDHINIFGTNYTWAECSEILGVNAGSVRKYRSLNSLKEKMEAAINKELNKGEDQ